MIQRKHSFLSFFNSKDTKTNKLIKPKVVKRDKLSARNSANHPVIESHELQNDYDHVYQNKINNIVKQSRKSRDTDRDSCQLKSYHHNTQIEGPVDLNNNNKLLQNINTEKSPPSLHSSKIFINSPNLAIKSERERQLEQERDKYKLKLEKYEQRELKRKLQKEHRSRLNSQIESGSTHRTPLTSSDQDSTSISLIQGNDAPRRRKLTNDFVENKLMIRKQSNLLKTRPNTTYDSLPSNPPDKPMRSKSNSNLDSSNLEFSFKSQENQPVSRSNHNLNLPTEDYHPKQDENENSDTNDRVNQVGQTGELNRQLNENSSRYQKVHKSQTFRTKFSRYNKPSRAKSDLSHRTRPPVKNKSASDLRFDLEDVSNNLRSNNLNKSYADLKSNLYISTNKLNDGYSNLDYQDQDFDLDDELELVNDQYRESIDQLTPPKHFHSKVKVSKSYSDFTKKTNLTCKKIMDPVTVNCNLNVYKLHTQSNQHKQQNQTSSKSYHNSPQLSLHRNPTFSNTSNHDVKSSESVPQFGRNKSFSHQLVKPVAVAVKKEKSKSNNIYKKVKRKLTNAAERTGLSSSKNDLSKDFSIMNNKHQYHAQSQNNFHNNETCTNSSGIVTHTDTTKTNEDRSSLEESQALNSHYDQTSFQSGQNTNTNTLSSGHHINFNPHQQLLNHNIYMKSGKKEIKINLQGNNINKSTNDLIRNRETSLSPRLNSESFNLKAGKQQKFRSTSLYHLKGSFDNDVDPTNDNLASNNNKNHDSNSWQEKIPTPKPRTNQKVKRATATTRSIKLSTNPNLVNSTNFVREKSLTNDYLNDRRNSLIEKRNSLRLQTKSNEILSGDKLTLRHMSTNTKDTEYSESDYTSDISDTQTTSSEYSESDEGIDDDLVHHRRSKKQSKRKSRLHSSTSQNSKNIKITTHLNSTGESNVKDKINYFDSQSRNSTENILEPTSANNDVQSLDRIKNRRRTSSFIKIRSNFNSRENIIEDRYKIVEKEENLDDDSYQEKAEKSFQDQKQQTSDSRSKTGSDSESTDSEIFQPTAKSKQKPTTKTESHNTEPKINSQSSNTPKIIRSRNLTPKSPAISNDSKNLKTKLLKNFKSNPNFVKRSITSISAKGDAVRHRFQTQKLLKKKAEEAGKSNTNSHKTAGELFGDREILGDSQDKEDDDLFGMKNQNQNSAGDNQPASINYNNPYAINAFANSGLVTSSNNTKKYSSTALNASTYRNFLKEKFSPKINAYQKNLASGFSTITIGSPPLTASQIDAKIKKEIELHHQKHNLGGGLGQINSNNNSANQQLNLLMSKTMKWVMQQDFKKYMPEDIIEYRMDPLTLQIGH